MELWTNDEINRILLYLENGSWLFPGYRFAKSENGLSKLGHGASALVYDAIKQNDTTSKYAIKVIGFNSLSVNDEFFEEAAKAQMMVAKSSRNVIRIYDYKQLWVYFDSQDNIVKVSNAKLEQPGLNCLHLQMVLMEKATPVFARDEKGAITLQNVKTLELAHDIADALAKAHNKGIFHRDVKLENIFYSEEEKIYKLGDFGIARVSARGAASTVAFTKGYGAPEVVSTLEDKYDNTADIYSFGIMLYLLYNNMKFPASDGYIVNAKEQYAKGFVATPPANATPELARIILKLCAYRPDDRFQYMETVANELEKLLYGRVYSYRRKHKKGIGVIMAVYLVLYVLSHINPGMWLYSFDIENWVLVPLIPFILELWMLRLPPRHSISKFYRMGLYWLLIIIGSMIYIAIPSQTAMFKPFVEDGVQLDSVYQLAISEPYYDSSMDVGCWIFVLSVIRVISSRIMAVRKK